MDSTHVFPDSHHGSHKRSKKCSKIALILVLFNTLNMLNWIFSTYIPAQISCFTDRTLSSLLLHPQIHLNILIVETASINTTNGKINLTSLTPQPTSPTAFPSAQLIWFCHSQSVCHWDPHFEIFAGFRNDKMAKFLPGSLLLSLKSLPILENFS